MINQTAIGAENTIGTEIASRRKVGVGGDKIGEILLSQGKISRMIVSAVKPMRDSYLPNDKDLKWRN